MAAAAPPAEAVPPMTSEKSEQAESAAPAPDAPAPAPEAAAPPPTINEPAVLPAETEAERLVKIKTAIEEEEAQTGKKFVPFLDPIPASTPAPCAELTAEQLQKYDSILAYAKAIESVPVSSAKGAEKKPLDPDERMWLTKECILRYLRASKWDIESTKKRLESSLVWRREYGLREHTAEYISPENETGKQVILGYDNEGRPCLYLNPARQNTQRSDRQLHHLVWCLERIVDLMPPGQESLALLVDFKASTSSSNPSVAQGREVIQILQNHYPERLGRALVINMPWFVRTFFTLINPFIDPVTREKLKFNENLRMHVPPEQLDKRFGGDCDFEYIHEKYWPELVRIAKLKRNAYIKRWEAGGSQIGASEFELKGGKKSEALIDDMNKLKVTS